MPTTTSRDDLLDIIHHTNLLFFGRGRLIEAQRKPEPDRSSLDWVVIDYHLFAMTHLLDFVCIRDGGLIRARLKKHSLENLLLPVDEILARRAGSLTVRELIQGFRDKVMTHPYSSFTPGMREVRDGDEPRSEFERQTNELLDRLHELGKEIEKIFHET